jgi:hypothetical protein
MQRFHLKAMLCNSTYHFGTVIFLGSVVASLTNTKFILINIMLGG